MTHIVREGFKPISIGTNGTLVFSPAYLGGFLAKTTGTITITIQVGGYTSVSTVTILDAIPVTAGIYTPIPAYFTPVQNGCTVTLGSGAAGTLFA
jgi:hypothetical protein